MDYRLQSILERALCPKVLREDTYTITPNYAKFLNWNVDTSSLFKIPVFKFSKISDNIYSNYSEDNTYNYKLPISFQDVYERSSVGIIIKDIFNNTWGNSFFKVKLKKTGDIYSGRAGIIMSPNNNILFLATYECTLSDNVINIIRPVISINPCVFVNQDDPINKYIIKTLIPFYLQVDIDNPINLRSFPSVHVSPSFVHTPKIEIESFDSLLESPTVPNSTDYEKEIQEFLKEDNCSKFLEFLQSDISTSI